MTNNEIICGALEPLGLPVAEGVYRGTEEEYFVFNEIAERDVEGDDDAADRKTEYYVSYYCRSDPHPMKRTVRARLKAAGIGVDSVQVLYDEDGQQRYHVVFDCFLLNTEDTPAPRVVITANGEHDVTGIAIAEVNVRPTVTLQDKTVTPGEQAQTVTADQGFDGLGAVTVEAIPEQYVVPTGSQTFTEDGTYDVSALAQAVIQTAPSKGVFFTDYDVDGYPHGISFVGISSIPNMYLQRNVQDNNSLLSRITAITMDGSVTAIGNNAFERTNITEIDFPASVTNWGSYIVRYCVSLRKCTFRGDVNMGYYFFNNDAALEEVHWRGNITNWNSPGFQNAMRLYDFTGCTQIPPLGNVSWIGYGAGTVIQVKAALLASWKAETNWCDLPTDSTAERYVVWEGV